MYRIAAFFLTALFLIPSAGHASAITWTWHEDSVVSGNGVTPPAAPFSAQFSIDGSVNIDFCTSGYSCPNPIQPAANPGPVPLPAGLDSFDVPYVIFTSPSLSNPDFPSWQLQITADDTALDIHLTYYNVNDTETVFINNDTIDWGSDANGCYCIYTGHWTVAAADPPPVPEPSALLILSSALGLLGLAAPYYRRDAFPRQAAGQPAPPSAG